MEKLKAAERETLRGLMCAAKGAEQALKLYVRHLVTSRGLDPAIIGVKNDLSAFEQINAAK